jgi:hypothetical protein
MRVGMGIILPAIPRLSLEEVSSVQAPDRDGDRRYDGRRRRPLGAIFGDKKGALIGAAAGEG